jgi:hypothetical protein
MCLFPLQVPSGVIKRGNKNPSFNWCLMGKPSNYKWWIFHCHVDDTGGWLSLEFLIFQAKYFN